jgi:hypothetical protein
MRLLLKILAMDIALSSRGTVGFQTPTASGNEL